MRLLLIIGVVVAVVFLIVMFIAPGGPPLDLEAQRSVARDFDSGGPPDLLKSLGAIVPSRPIPIETPPATCPQGTTHFAAAGEGWRVLRMALTGGNTGLVVVALLEPRRDHETGPYRICLGNGPSLDLVGCSNERIQPNASVPIGPHGGCISVLARSPPSEIGFNQTR